jgi:hypothetical protein|tara:strand:- start:108 stop:296 length:189 start_codon:yes stop_codon:yes gene_type:complete
MDWTSKEKSKYWNKAYREYSLESGIPIESDDGLNLINYIKINPYVAEAIENRAIEFLNQGKL